MSTQPPPPSPARRRTIAGLLLLCLLWAIDTLRPDLLPNLSSAAIPPFQKQALTFALLALLSSAIAIIRHTPAALSPLLGRTLLAAIGLFLLPAALMAFSQNSVSPLTRVALFALVPVFALVFEPYIGHGPETRSRGALIAALLALLGSLCIFRIQIPSSLQAVIGFAAILLAAASIAAANCLATGTAVASTARSTAPIATITGILCAVSFAAASLAFEHPTWEWKPLAIELVWSAIIKVPAILLLFWLMRRLSASRMATRYIFAPIIAILFEFLLLQPPMEPQAWLGLALMALGAGYLLLAPNEKDDNTALTLNI